MKRAFAINFIVLILLSVFVNSIDAQTTAFVYQGKLNDANLPANGTYQFEFKLFSAASGGSQIAQTIVDLPATVTNGIFAVDLDFGAGAFDGAERYLEISVRQSGSSQPYTTLTPRQPITSTPYAVKSLKSEEAKTALTANDSLRLGSIPASEYVQTTDTRMSDARAPLPDSPYYIRNSQSQQTSSNFNISGEGKANVFNATGQFNLNGNRILSGSANGNLFAGFESGTNNTGASNTFVGSFAGQNNLGGNFNSFFGRNAGQSNTTAGFNSFFGTNAGLLNTTGARNTFTGAEAGQNNLTGSDNSFFGTSAGKANATGSFNSFFGRSAGQANTTGGQNAFFGRDAGFNTTEGNNNTFVGASSGFTNSTGVDNSFFGFLAGRFTTTGNANTFVGTNTGANNTTGSNNTYLGFNAQGAPDITNATALGANAQVTASNTMVLGTNAVAVQVPGSLNVAGTFSANALNSGTVYKIGGNRVFHLTGTENTFVGFESGNSITTGSLNAFFGTFAGKGTTTGINNSFFGSYAGRDNISGGNNSFFGANAGLGNKTGNANSFFGSASGLSNINGSDNAFFGTSSGENNGSGINNSYFGRSAGKTSSASGNSFFGAFAGEKTTSGENNTFIGNLTGSKNLTGSGNTFIGALTNSQVNADTIGNNNTAVGYNNRFGAGVSNSMAIGANISIISSNQTVIGGELIIMGNNFGSAQVVMSNLSADDISGNKISTQSGNITGLLEVDTISAPNPSTESYIATLKVTNLNVGGAINSSATFTGAVQAQSVRVNTLFGGGTTEVCSFTQGSYKVLAQCSSSRRYKDNIQTFTGGLSLVKRLRPVTFNWKSDGQPDVGFVAEEVGEVEPLLNNYNQQGEIEGVKYAQVTTVLVNAVKEQQAQIETQKTENQKLQDQIKQQQMQIDALKAIVCATNKDATICQPDK